MLYKIVTKFSYIIATISIISVANAGLEKHSELSIQDDSQMQPIRKDEPKKFRSKVNSTNSSKLRRSKNKKSSHKLSTLKDWEDTFLAEKEYRPEEDVEYISVESELETEEHLKLNRLAIIEKSTKKSFKARAKGAKKIKKLLLNTQWEGLITKHRNQSVIIQPELNIDSDECLKQLRFAYSSQGKTSIFKSFFGPINCREKRARPYKEIVYIKFEKDKCTASITLPELYSILGDHCFSGKWYMEMNKNIGYNPKQILYVKLISKNNAKWKLYYIFECRLKNGNELELIELNNEFKHEQKTSVLGTARDCTVLRKIDNSISVIGTSFTRDEILDGFDRFSEPEININGVKYFKFQNSKPELKELVGKYRILDGEDYIPFELFNDSTAEALGIKYLADIKHSYLIDDLEQKRPYWCLVFDPKNEDIRKKSWVIYRNDEGHFVLSKSVKIRDKKPNSMIPTKVSKPEYYVRDL